jgi:hypothetical protein
LFAFVFRGEQLDVPDETMSSILDSCFGDVRHAISALQYLCVAQTAAAASANGVDARSFDGKSKGKKVPSKRGKKKGKESSAAASGGCDLVAGPDGTPLSISTAADSSRRDENFSVFHSAGKILYAKSSEAREVEAIVEAADVTALTFLEWIHTNYVEHLVPPTLPSIGRSTGKAAAEAHRLPATKPTATVASVPAGASAAANVPSSSAVPPPPVASPSSSKYFSDDDDVFGPDDIGAFDRAISSATSAAAAAASAASTAKKHEDVDEEALNALVLVTEDFSQADILASGAKSHFGDVSATLCSAC